MARETYWRDPEKNRKRMAEWSKANKKHVYNYNKQYRKENAAKVYAQDSSHHARGLGAAMPSSEIEKLMVLYKYEDALALSAETGVKHEVDHMIPLSKGGPHLPWNLQVLTRSENRQKYNSI